MIARLPSQSSAFDPVADARSILHHSCQTHHPAKVFALFSGGHDSLCAAHLCSSMNRFDGCVHINTGIGIQETLDYVRSTCKKHDWPLFEYTPPVSYEAIVLQWGFPGPAGHALAYQRLKERCIAALVREHKTRWSDRILLVTGVRRQESRRRMGIATAIHRQGARVWTAPLLNWSSSQKNDYIDSNRLERNPVVERLCMSGECLCGAFARKGEIEEIEFWYPEAAKKIHALERKARAAGVHAVWGTRPAKKVEPPGEQPELALCWSCEAKRQAQEEIESQPDAAKEAS